MKNVKDYSRVIAIVVLLICGGCAIVFGKSVKIQGGIGALCWGIALIVFAFIAKDKNEQELQDFDEGVQFIMYDIAENKEESEYYGYNIQMFDVARKKIEKKQRKQMFTFWAFSAVLIIVALIFFV